MMAGISESEFWNMTPREIWYRLESFRRTQELETRRALLIAHQAGSIFAMAMNGKRIPALADYIGGGKKRISEEEIISRRNEMKSNLDKMAIDVNALFKRAKKRGAK